MGFAEWGGLRDGDAFSLPMNPRAELPAAFDRNGGSLPTSHAIPYGVRDWVVCEHGDHLRWRRAENSNDAVRALQFLVRHYLGRDALAKESGHPDFAEFTFDHRLDGVIAGSGPTPTSCSCCESSTTTSPGRPWFPAMTPQDDCG